MIIADARNPTGDERHQDQQAQPEARQRQAGKRNEADDIIGPAVLLHRADHAERQPEQHGEEQRQPRELCRDRDARRQLVDRRQFRDVGITQVALHQPADPNPVLLPQRQIEAQLLLQIGLFLRVDETGGVEQDVGDIAGHQAQQDEDDDRHADQCHNHQQQAAYDIGGHGMLARQRASPFHEAAAICPATHPPDASHCRCCWSSACIPSRTAASIAPRGRGR